MKLKSILPLLAAGVVTVLAVAGLAGAAGTPPKNTSLPTISGTTEQGQTLTGHAGQWTGDQPISYAWRWKRCNAFGNKCANIAGATSQAYVLKNSDVGTKLRLNVTAKNGAGSAVAESNPSALVQPKGATPPPPAPAVNGCPTGTGALDVSQIAPPARLVIDGQVSAPTPITRTVTTLQLRFHVSACNGRSIGNALVYAAAIPFQQFSTPAEVATDATGWATLNLQRMAGFPASPRQQILAVFSRARKSGESPLGGVTGSRLVSFPVHLNG
jgi:hypothetical protein